MSRCSECGVEMGSIGVHLTGCPVLKGRAIAQDAIAQSIAADVQRQQAQASSGKLLGPCFGVDREADYHNLRDLARIAELEAQHAAQKDSIAGYQRRVADLEDAVRVAARGPLYMTKEERSVGETVSVEMATVREDLRRKREECERLEAHLGDTLRAAARSQEEANGLRIRIAELDGEVRRLRRGKR